ncbi:hypothetical protein CsSME_00040979 [Camellia sinensis var. sinensis]
MDCIKTEKTCAPHPLSPTMADEYNLSDFIVCTPICPDISDDTRLEALRAKLKQGKNEKQTEAQDDPNEAQSALNLGPEERNEVDNSGTGNLQVPDQTPTVRSPAQEPSGPTRCGRHRRQLGIDAEDWLPHGWKMITKVRKYGRSAGNVDKYYLGPGDRCCRSKKEVLLYINQMNRAAEVSTSED